MGKVVLCADSTSLAMPGLLGLSDADLSSISWLEAFNGAESVRERMKNAKDIDEVWVASSDDVDAINLAAALRKDNPELKILLILFETTGSSLSRAQAAGVTGVLAAESFAKRFAMESIRRNRMQDVESLSIDEYISEPVEPKETIKQPKHTTLQINEVAEVASDSNDVSDIKSFVLTIVSGSGGAGKSTISAVAASIAFAKGFKTVLLDCDLQFGDTHRLLGIEKPITVDEVLTDTTAISRLATLSADRKIPAVLSAPCRLEHSEDLSKHLNEILGICSNAFDVIIVNTGANWADHHASLMELSTYTLFVVDQRASSVRACQHALDLCMRMGIASGTFEYALNRCGRGALFTSIDIACALQGVHVYELLDGGLEIEEMCGAGHASKLAETGNPFVKSVTEMLDVMLPDFAMLGKHQQSAAVSSAGSFDTSDNSQQSFDLRNLPNRKGHKRRTNRRTKHADLKARFDFGTTQNVMSEKSMFEGIGR